VITESMGGVSHYGDRSSAVDIRALLVSADPITIQRVSHVLREFSISPDVSEEMSEAVRRVIGQKFDAVIVDLQLEEQSGLILDQVHLSSSNRTAVTFAIGGGDAVGNSLRKKAAFVFERPVSTQSIRSTLKTAYGLILRERRRYFRCPISIPVTILRQNMPEVRCHSVNISEGGMSLSTFAPFSVGEDVQVRFIIPGDKILFEAESRICWLRMGSMGIRFVTLSPDLMSELQDWLSRRLEESLPEAVALNFRKSRSFSPMSPGSREQN